MKPKCLIVAHGHPDLSVGGAEIAAHNLFKALSDQFDCAFLARRGSWGSSAPIEHYRDNEYFFNNHTADWVLQRTPDQKEFTKRYLELIQTLRPDVIHFHHYIGLGLDIFRVTKNALPDTKIILTFHEYMLICLQNGQMVTKNDHRLCTEANSYKCNQCFPNVPVDMFDLRKQQFLAQLQFVDTFHSPSNFLKDRYVAWGLPESKFRVIENVITPPTKKLKKEKGRKVKFGFFGQLNPFKGIDLVLDAAKSLLKEHPDDFELYLNGANLHFQDDEFSSSLKKKIKKLESQTILIDRGQYSTHELYSRLQEIDWTILGSIWWENSPMVIQESIMAHTPLIVPNIGGMAEKVDEAVGIQYNARDPKALAGKMKEALLIDNTKFNFEAHLEQVGNVAERYKELYRKPA